MLRIVWIYWRDGRATAVTEDIARGYLAHPDLAPRIVRTTLEN